LLQRQVTLERHSFKARWPFWIGRHVHLAHYPEIFEDKPKVGFFEIISENFLELSGKPRQNLDRILKDYAVVMHGVSMNLGSSDPLNWDYLKKLKRLAQHTGTPYVTDHLCWNGVNGAHYHDLLPLPYTEENAQYIAERIRRVQDFLDLPFGIENLSSYVSFQSSEMTEWEFLNRVVELSGCHYMFDINNVFVSSVNHGFNPNNYLDVIHWDKVLQCHMAGHSVQPDGSIIDTHDHHVVDPVWRLYQYAWKLSGGFRTMLEWDAHFISFKETHKEALKARQYQTGAQAPHKPAVLSGSR
jgi:uncharacterized protein (UPF0276 family)